MAVPRPARTEEACARDPRRHRLPRAIAFAAAGFAAVLAVRPARAAREPVQFHYEVPPGTTACPTESEFVARVSDLGVDLRSDPGFESARRFAVSIEGAGPFVGKLRIRDAKGGERSREVSGEDCESVVQPLSLFVSLAVDDAPAQPPQVSADAAVDLRPEVHVEPDKQAPTTPTTPTSRRGGIGADAFVLGTLGSITQASYGAHVTAGTLVSSHAYVGGSLAFANDASDQGFSGWLGALVGWGAPWTDGIGGVSFEAGVRVSRVVGYSDPGSRDQGGCTSLSPPLSSCISGAAQWSSEAPYVAASVVVQVPLRDSHFRPYFSHTSLGSTDLHRLFVFGATLNAGVAWQAW
jgi:hypothetical protein